MRTYLSEIERGRGEGSTGLGMGGRCHDQTEDVPGFGEAIARLMLDLDSENEELKSFNF